MYSPPLSKSMLEDFLESFQRDSPTVGKNSSPEKKEAKYKVAIKGYFIKSCGADGAAWCRAFSHFAERMG